MIRIALVAAVMALPLPALAQDAAIREGEYVGSGEGDLSATITHIQDDIYAVSLETVVPISDAGAGCAGGIDGEMILSKKGGNFFVENADYDADLGPSPVNARMCEIGMSFVDGILVIEERDGCMPYHGAACSFTGELLHETAVN